MINLIKKLAVLIFAGGMLAACNTTGDGRSVGLGTRASGWVACTGSVPVPFKVDWKIGGRGSCQLEVDIGAVGAFAASRRTEGTVPGRIGSERYAVRVTREGDTVYIHPWEKRGVYGEVASAPSSPPSLVAEPAVRKDAVSPRTAALDGEWQRRRTAGHTPAVVLPPVEEEYIAPAPRRQYVHPRSQGVCLSKCEVTVHVHRY